MIVGEVTEENLPEYAIAIEESAAGNEVLLEWNNRWTAEESRHGYAIHVLMALGRLIDPLEQERIRMAQITKGQVPQPPTPLDAIAYVTLQELATQISHRNTGLLTKEHIDATITDDLPESEQIRRRIIGASALEIMTRVAKDETLHYRFYRSGLEAAMDIDPSQAVKAI